MVDFWARGRVEPSAFRFLGFRITVQLRPSWSFYVLDDLRYTPDRRGCAWMYETRNETNRRLVSCGKRRVLTTFRL